MYTIQYWKNRYDSLPEDAMPKSKRNDVSFRRYVTGDFFERSLSEIRLPSEEEKAALLSKCDEELKELLTQGINEIVSIEVLEEEF